MAIGATSDLFPLSTLSYCSALETMVASLPSLWGKLWEAGSPPGSALQAGLGRKWVCHVGGLGPQGRHLPRGQNRHGKSWTGLEQVHGEDTAQTRPLRAWRSHPLGLLPLLVCPAHAAEEHCSPARSEGAKSHPVTQPSCREKLISWLTQV